MLREQLEQVRRKKPLIHNITNYVTVNDCANILLACGASPIMADDKAEAEQITSLCAGLNINIGTLNERTIPSMFLAGKKANEINHPVLLDPVGAGASKLRTDTARQLIEEIQFSVIRGNISEIKTLAYGMGTTKGVDADEADCIREETLDYAVKLGMEFAKKTGAVVVITGAIDIIAAKDQAYIIRNGHPIMSDITGSGCMLSAMLTAYIAANENPLKAAAAAVCAMGICGENAQKRMTQEDGNAAFRNYLLDAAYRLEGEQLEQRANIEKREREEKR